MPTARPVNAPAQQQMDDPVAVERMAGNWYNPALGLKGWMCLSARGQDALCMLGCFVGACLTRDAGNPNRFSGCACCSFEYEAATDSLKDGCGGRYRRS